MPTGSHSRRLTGASKAHAPDFGQSVHIDNYRYPGADYAGATRPVK
jgi:hypothetical protein